MKKLIFLLALCQTAKAQTITRPFFYSRDSIDWEYIDAHPKMKLDIDKSPKQYIIAMDSNFNTTCKITVSPDGSIEIKGDTVDMIKKLLKELKIEPFYKKEPIAVIPLDTFKNWKIDSNWHISNWGTSQYGGTIKSVHKKSKKNGLRR